ncbi:MAG: hypothetical protein Q8O52_23425 [Sulfuritalea sp.]|nr:hypothetical protein [Sulfuritalea sp.]
MHDEDCDNEPVLDRPRDEAIDAAAPRILQIFNDAPSRVFYSTQIETQLEREIFHWITNKALLELANAGNIQRMPAVVQGKSVNFYAPSEISVLEARTETTTGTAGADFRSRVHPCNWPARGNDVRLGTISSRIHD